MTSLHDLSDNQRFQMLFLILSRTMGQASGMFTVASDNKMSASANRQLKAVQTEMNRFEAKVMAGWKPEKKEQCRELVEELSVLYYDLLHDLHSDEDDKYRLLALAEIDKVDHPEMAVLTLKLMNMGVLKSPYGNPIKDMTMEEYVAEQERYQEETKGEDT